MKIQPVMISAINNLRKNANFKGVSIDGYTPMSQNPEGADSKDNVVKKLDIAYQTIRKNAKKKRKRFGGFLKKDEFEQLNAMKIIK